VYLVTLVLIYTSRVYRTLRGQPNPAEDFRSDDYLKARLPDYNLHLDGMIIPEWSDIRGLGQIKNELEANVTVRMSSLMAITATVANLLAKEGK
jgi:hypothetical protein